MARNNFSGGIEGRPISEYISPKHPSSDDKASSTKDRIVLSG